MRQHTDIIFYSIQLYLEFKIPYRRLYTLYKMPLFARAQGLGHVVTGSRGLGMSSKRAWVTVDRDPGPFGRAWVRVPKGPESRS